MFQSAQQYLVVRAVHQDSHATPHRFCEDTEGAIGLFFLLYGFLFFWRHGHTPLSVCQDVVTNALIDVAHWSSLGEALMDILFFPAGVIYIVLSIVLYLDLYGFVLSRFLSDVYCRYDPNDLIVLVLHLLHLMVVSDLLSQSHCSARDYESA